jgi:acetyl-CoA acetyltransferase
MRDVVVAGVGMTRFGRFLDRTFASLVTEATGAALADAGAATDDVGFVYYSNSGAGLIQGQESVRGQHAVRGSGLEGIPLINVENACASGSTAVNQAWLAVAAGQVDVAVAVGAEKLNHTDRSRAFAVMTAALDQDRLEEIRSELGDTGTGSVFMDVYARFARWYRERTDATPSDFAQVAVKNHAHGALNPKAQYGGALTVEEVLGARPISGDLTLPMCAPMSDGAAAAVITTPEIAARWGAEPARLLATVIGAARPGVYGELVPDTARRAYEMAGLGPDAVDVVECHDAASPAELIVMEELGLCSAGEAPALLREGVTSLGGRLPVNPSGGLGSRGHPVGATGLGQLVELVDQVRGRCGARQVDGARIGLAENAGGYIGPDAAAASVTIVGAT